MTDADTSLRIVYMGTPDFAVPALDALLGSRHEVVGVVTNPDRGAGRGKKVTPTPVKARALEDDVPVYQPKKLRGDPDAAARLADFEADLFVVAAYGQILPREILEIPPRGCLNIHASLLPAYRGAAPINWCIVRGEATSGVTIMQMEEGLDTGPMLSRAEVFVPELMTAQHLHDALSALGAELLLTTLDGLLDGSITPEPQDDSQASWAPMISKSDGLVDWTDSAVDVANLIRGFNPWPGAYTFHADPDTGALGRLKLHLARPLDRDHDAPAGQVLVADGDELVVACGQGAVAILELQAPGRRAMGPRDFLNGYELAAGQFLVSGEQAS